MLYRSIISLATEQGTVFSCDARSGPVALLPKTMQQKDSSVYNPPTYVVPPWNCGRNDRVRKGSWTGKLLGLVPGVSRRGPKPLGSRLVGHMVKKGVGCDEEIVDGGYNAARF